MLWGRALEYSSVVSVRFGFEMGVSDLSESGYTWKITAAIEGCKSISPDLQKLEREVAFHREWTGQGETEESAIKELHDRVKSDLDGFIHQHEAAAATAREAKTILHYGSEDLSWLWRSGRPRPAGPLTLDLVAPDPT